MYILLLLLLLDWRVLKCAVLTLTLTLADLRGD
jgi:hypothetical protein